MWSWSSVAREPFIPGAGPVLAARQAQQALRMAWARPGQPLRLRGATVDGVTPPLLAADGTRMGPAMAACLLALAHAPLRWQGAWAAARAWLDEHRLLSLPPLADELPVWVCEAQALDAAADAAPDAADSCWLVEVPRLASGELPAELAPWRARRLLLTSQDLLMAWPGASATGAAH